ncbi:MAG: OB-fold nucleic acid binding domain-containing protein [Candidatus Micrarchaeota archaeon]|nr:OB-fold nucleic acid binding domain-containing protein [Candidatus Micrarchaeota archaeon]
MKISDLKPGTGNANIEGEITAVDEPRDVVTKFGKKTRVANAKIKDASGDITLTLWGDDIDKVSIGDTVQIENGWVSEFKSEKQISAGKYGKITVAK